MCYLINTEDFKLMILDNGWCSALQSICQRNSNRIMPMEMQNVGNNASCKQTSVITTNFNATDISNVSLPYFKSFCRLELLKEKTGKFSLFEMKQRQRVELLIRIENILSHKKWDLSDNLLTSLLNRFILSNCKNAKEPQLALQRVNNMELDIISVQSSVAQYAIDQKSLFQEMVQCVNCEETYLSFLNKLLNLECQIERELNMNHVPTDEVVASDESNEHQPSG